MSSEVYPVTTGRLVVFVKSPRPGFVKTRLASTLGDAAACDAYRQLMGTVLRNVSGFSSVEVRFTPDDARTEISQWLQPAWTAKGQGDGDLGVRLHRAFAENFAERDSPVVVIGSDCPSVTPADIEAAWLSLATHDVVLGPAEDGGYWLIGLRQRRPQLFQNIPWSTDTVLAETQQRARTSGLSVAQLRTLADVDSSDDWSRFQKERSGQFPS